MAQLDDVKVWSEGRTVVVDEEFPSLYGLDVDEFEIIMGCRNLYDCWDVLSDKDQDSSFMICMFVSLEVNASIGENVCSCFSFFFFNR